MIHKGVVLRRVQDFQQCCGGIAAKIRAEFVDFIQHEYGIFCAGASQALYDASGQCADVGAAVSSNFRFVADAAQ